MTRATAQQVSRFWIFAGILARFPRRRLPRQQLPLPGFSSAAAPNPLADTTVNPGKTVLCLTWRRVSPKTWPNAAAFPLPSGSPKTGVTLAQRSRASHRPRGALLPGPQAGRRRIIN